MSVHPIPEIRDATRADVDLIARTLGDAFTDDPVMSWLIPPTARRRSQRIQAVFAQTAREYLRAGKPIHLSEDGQGAAIWAPPGTWFPSAREQLRDLPRFAVVFGTGLVRSSRFLTEVVRKHPRSPEHWYLYMLGTHRSAQGRGIGSALLREMLERIDEAGEPAYLESSNIRNVPLYERQGFTVVEEITIGRDGPTMWRMWREPRS
jgi:ribosomal protein S18 acetylase RimI-like enzyme